MASSRSSLGASVALSALLSSVITLVVVSAALVATGVVDPSTFTVARPGPAKILVPAAPRSVIERDEAVVGVVKRASPSVVSIIITRDLPLYQRNPNAFDPFGGLFSTPEPTGETQRQRVGGGSGFFISEDGMILTNKHVVDYEDADYTVVLNSGKTLPATVLARDPSNDIAIMKVEGASFPALPLGDSSKIQIGQSVIAIGNALGEFQNTVSVGVVSGLARSITAGGSDGFVETLEGVLQTDAAINPGNSGGPLLNLAGEVIGINTAVAANAQSIGFAIVINDAKQDIASVREKGKIERAYLGVRYVTLNEELQEKNNLTVSEGAFIQGEGDSPAVVPGSPAAKAGLRAGDVIVEVDGEDVTRESPLWRLVGGKGVGDDVRLGVVSGDQRRTITVRLEAAPAQE